MTATGGFLSVVGLVIGDRSRDACTPVHAVPRTDRRASIRGVFVEGDNMNWLTQHIDVARRLQRWRETH